MNSFRGGMQVHAVPDDERALDAGGQPLPWGYAYADSSVSRKTPIEKGPFGRPTTVRRGTSKTATPGPPENPDKLRDLKVIDDVFSQFKKELEDREVRPVREQKPPTSSTGLPHARSAMDLTQPMSSAPPPPGVGGMKEPTEVLIYGYGPDYQYAAIDFYENVSGGRIYEDYDRYPAHPRYNTLLTTSRPTISRNLPSNIIRKINTFQGGNHWIKVTFDSPEAADRACWFSPHVVHGYSCIAEPWRGVGPNADTPIFTHSASLSDGAEALRQRRPIPPNQAKGWNSMPSRIHSAPLLTTETLSSDISSTSSTASSATATGNASQNLQPILEASSNPSSPNASTQAPAPEMKALRVRGAKRAVLLPATSALLPVPPWSQRTFGHLPLLGSLFGGDYRLRPGEVAGGGIIGVAVPRKEDGNFDWEKASWYWRACWCLDRWAGTDLCGLKGEE